MDTYLVNATHPIRGSDIGWVLDRNLPVPVNDVIVHMKKKTKRERLKLKKRKDFRICSGRF